MTLCPELYNIYLVQHLAKPVKYINSLKSQDQNPSRTSESTSVTSIRNFPRDVWIYTFPHEAENQKFVRYW